MRILIVTQYFWPEAFRVNEIVEFLTGNGHDVTVLTGKPNYPAGKIFESYARSPEQFVDYHGAKIIRVPLVPRGRTKAGLLANYISFALSATSLGLIKLSGRKFDVIFMFQLSPVMSALPAVALRRAKRAPLAMLILDLWPETLQSIGIVRSQRGLAIVGRLVSFIYRRCDAVLVQSRAFVPGVRHYGGQDRDIRYLPAWVESVFEKNELPVLPAPELEAFKGAFTVVFAGNIGEAQDFPAILAAATLLRDRADVKWVVIGDGRAVDSVRAEIAARDLSNCVFLLGRFPADRMPDFFAGASALLVSLKAEPAFSMTIPGKVQSYMSAGKPILAMLDGEGGRIVEEAGAGLVVASGDGAGLAAAVLRLAAASVEERQKMGAAGKRYCQENFDRRTLLSRLETWLGDLAARKI